MNSKTLAQQLKDFLGKDEIKIVCSCVKCNKMIPMKIDEFADRLEAAGVDYNDWKQLKKFSHKFIQAAN